MSQSKTVRKLRSQFITEENFRPFGQLITPSADGKVYDQRDAQLNLDNGTPRFYIMQLRDRGRHFHSITRHRLCTQCLGSLEGKEWFLAVAPPSEADRPPIEDIQAFKIPGNCFVKLAQGTWHAGPYFDFEVVNFYNLELTDTNIVDHFSHDFHKSDSLMFEIV